MFAMQIIMLLLRMLPVLLHVAEFLGIKLLLITHLYLLLDHRIIQYDCRRIVYYRSIIIS